MGISKHSSATQHGKSKYSVLGSSNEGIIVLSGDCVLQFVSKRTGVGADSTVRPAIAVTDVFYGDQLLKPLPAGLLSTDSNLPWGLLYSV